MKNLRKFPLVNLFNNYMIDAPEPSNINYFWNFGSLLATVLGIQILSGIFLAMFYTPHFDLAFLSVEHIMREVNYGWLIRYMHATGASFFFAFLYLHIARGLFYGSYRRPRTLTWTIGTAIFFLTILTAFLGYTLPNSQTSYWGATVITNLVSSIPFIGHDLVEFLWGGFNVNNATLNRFFSLHYLLPFIISALAIMHMIALHTNGSSNPLGITGNLDRIPMSPHYLIKDLVTIFLFFIIFSIIIFYFPTILSDADNAVPADPMKTPMSIVPEWYLLPFYAILRSIPNKLFGVIAMFFAIFILFFLPLLDFNYIRGNKFQPIGKLLFWCFISNFILLMFIGAKHVEIPYVAIGTYATLFYFAYFVFFIPLSSLISNTLLDLNQKSNSITK
uniref:Cytochrome b n=1 Tax=Schizosaccharomyces japonicus TaxID=4897 RepID=CYB_SCHJP|nr:apocytochrome b [Schizosaccharomyces japonicus]Q8HMZ7.1 RecName: Full=Cytochrome b; AltName: Full=Complex III subunit 3; AltName: Full=Complex III subunit III; AltName: Full=Cytochrome b-c1 complex subunit 3; AltName: Full=Ubiquinol-cytochrome-c reductase complex cytochrome b subunit [Schizosaccharomyces japonicus]AAN37912.1 apocytochrome b [Schizosaccharomyces japonicus]